MNTILRVKSLQPIALRDKPLPPEGCRPCPCRRCAVGQCGTISKNSRQIAFLSDPLRARSLDLCGLCSPPKSRFDRCAGSVLSGTEVGRRSIVALWWKHAGADSLTKVGEVERRVSPTIESLGRRQIPLLGCSRIGRYASIRRVGRPTRDARFLLAGARVAAAGDNRHALFITCAARCTSVSVRPEPEMPTISMYRAQATLAYTSDNQGSVS